MGRKERQFRREGGRECGMEEETVWEGGREGGRDSVEGREGQRVWEGGREEESVGGRERRTVSCQYYEFI